MLTPSDKKEHLYFVSLELYFLKPMNLKTKDPSKVTEKPRNIR